MTDQPGPWGPQGGYPPSRPWWLPTSATRGIPTAAATRAIHRNRVFRLSSQEAATRRNVAYAPQPPPGYPPQQPGGYGPEGPAAGGPGAPPGAPQKKSPIMIIAIVVAAIVLLAAVGGIIMVLTRNGGGEQPDVSITPSQPVPPTEQPTPEPTGQPTTQEPQPTPTEPSQPPAGGTINLGNGIELHTGRRLGSGEDRQERGTTVRREECFPWPVTANHAVDQPWPTM